MLFSLALASFSFMLSCVQFVFVFKMNVQSLNISIQQRRLIEKVKLMQKNQSSTVLWMHTSIIIRTSKYVFCGNNSVRHLLVTLQSVFFLFFFCSLNSYLLFGRKNLHLEFAICKTGKTVSTKMAICNHKNY